MAKLNGGGMYGGGEVSRELGRNEKASLKTWRVGGRCTGGLTN